MLLLVILFETSNPVLNPSSKVSFNVKVPFEAPIEVSFCFDLSGTKASIWLSNFSLLPDWDAKWTVGVQNPDTHIQSHSIILIFSNPVLSLFNLPICADFTFLYPFAAIIAWENLILIFWFLTASINSEDCSSLVSKIIGSTPCFLNSKAVSYALSLFVNIKGFLPINTP